MTLRPRAGAGLMLAMGALLASSCNGKTHAPTTTRVAAYIATDACSAHADATTCGADSANGCTWDAIAIDCPAGSTCPTGICHGTSPCETHTDAASCGADTTNSCAWAEVSTALAPCPGGSSCTGTAGGFCYASSGGAAGDCACACPMYCPQGTDCPPCDCACPPPPSGGTGGGTCTCSCEACSPGEICPPCDCACVPVDSGSGSTCGGTCTCACESCPVGTSCPDCACTCDSGASPVPTEPTVPTCTCPTCAGTDPCPACDCPPVTTPDPCTVHTDEPSCTADTANACTFIALGIPCQVGEPCISGVCQQLLTTDAGVAPGGCVCGCPSCPDGAGCPPCGCDCTAGTGTSGCP